MNLHYLYFRYKDSVYYSLSIISVVFVVCIILLFNVILPQLISWFSIRNEVIATSGRIGILKQNINYMNNLDRGLLAAQLRVALSALPPEKDFSAIITAISDSAIRTGVSLDDFTFQVGNISSTSASAVNFLRNNIPGTKLQVQIEGDSSNVKDFIGELGRELPLSEVIAVDQQDQSASITIVFYNKALPRLAFHDEDPIQPLSNSKSSLLNTITSWQASQIPQANDTASQNASASAVPLF